MAARSDLSQRSSSRRSRPRRTLWEWVVRGLLAMAAGVVGYVSVTRTHALTIRANDIVSAVALAPDDARIIAFRAATLAGSEASPRNRAEAEHLARRALRQDATAAAAASALGINAQVRGQTQAARRLFAYAETLSRRDLPTQLWAIEDAVARNDIPGALRHYDIALRTSSNAAALLFPVLGSAITEPPIRRSLVATLARRPRWSELFVEHVAGNGSDPLATVLLFRELGQVGVPIAGVSQSLLINTLAARGAFDAAWSYYASIRRGADKRMSRDPRFAADIAMPAVFDWVPANADGLAASIQRTATDGLVDFSAPATVGGTLLSQSQMLPVGTYWLSGRSTAIDQAPNASPYWVLTCVDGRELGRIVVTNSSEAGGKFAGRLSVPAGCPVQVLMLVARPSDAVGGLSGQIEQVALRPLDQR